MTNLEKYVKAFSEALEVPESDVPALKYGESDQWDSVGHMTLIAALEDAFDIMVDMDDIIDLSSFEKGKEILRSAGFDVEDFGQGSVLVRSCPLDLSSEDIEPLFTEVAQYLMEHRHEVEPAKLDWLYHNVACRSAIKAGDNTSGYELDRFVARLLSDDSIRYCPHGRPVLIRLTRGELEKQFGRE